MSSIHLFSTNRVRFSFGKIPFSKDIPDLMKVQKESYDRFLQSNTNKERKNQGLENVLRSTFQVDDPDGKARLEFVNYVLGEPKYNASESIQRGVTYSAPLHVTLRLIIWDQENEESKEIRYKGTESNACRHSSHD